MKVKEKRMIKSYPGKRTPITNDNFENNLNYRIKKDRVNLKYLLNKTTLLKINLVRLVNFLSNVCLDIHFFIRKRKGFTSVPCLHPFTRLEFVVGGVVRTCCSHHTKVQSVGNIKYKTIEQIWNGKEIIRFRKRLLLGQTKKTCMPNCPRFFSPPNSIKEINTNVNEGTLLYDDIRTGRVKLSIHPLWFNLANSTACNLKCTMCGPAYKRGHLNGDIPGYVKKTHENLRRYFDKRITLYLTGNGDPLARKDTRELLQSFDNKKYNKVTFEILTNGLLFQPRMWEKIKHNNYNWVNISIDAATKETFEKIRYGGNWEQLMKALEVFKKAKEEGKFRNVIINMTVMRSNFREIPQFIKMARGMGFKSFLTKIRGKWENENFFESNDVETIQEMKTVLANPDIYGDDVHMVELTKYVPQKFRSRLHNFGLTFMHTPYFLMRSNVDSRS